MAQADPRIVFVLSNFTYPPREGLHAQSAHLIHGLAARGWLLRVIVLARDTRLLDASGFAAWCGANASIQVVRCRLNYPLLLLRNLFFWPWPPAVLGRVAAQAGDAPAVAHLEGIGLVPLVARLRRMPTVLSTVDAWSLRQLRLSVAARGAKKLFLRAYAGLTSFAERRYLPQASAVHVVSESDADWLRSAVPRADIRAIPVALIDGATATAAQAPRAGMRVVVWGDIGVPHLRAGLVWLLREVRPRVDAVLPGVRWTVLGRTPPDPQTRALARDAEFLAWVDDVAALLRSAGAVALPDASGTGLKNRAIHAMACGVPVVGTPAAFEGFAVMDNREALVRAGPADFADALRNMLASPDEARRVGNAGREFALRGFGPDAVIARWEALYREIAYRRLAMT
jgi:glycosyltransferase involved in cell wall biosynthesis